MLSLILAALLLLAIPPAQDRGAEREPPLKERVEAAVIAFTDFRLAQVALAAVDQGQSQDLWMSWRNDNQQDLQVSAKSPALPKKLQGRWDSDRGNRRKSVQQKRRGERGDDPQRDGG